MPKKKSTESKAKKPVRKDGSVEDLKCLIELTESFQMRAIEPILEDIRLEYERTGKLNHEKIQLAKEKQETIKEPWRNFLQNACSSDDDQS